MHYSSGRPDGDGPEDVRPDDGTYRFDPNPDLPSEDQPDKTLPSIEVTPDNFLQWIHLYPEPLQARILEYALATPTKIEVTKTTRGFTYGVTVRQYPGETTVHVQDRLKFVLQWLEENYGDKS